MTPFDLIPRPITTLVVTPVLDKDALSFYEAACADPTHTYCLFGPHEGTALAERLIEIEKRGDRWAPNFLAWSLLPPDGYDFGSTPRAKRRSQRAATKVLVAAPVRNRAWVLPLYLSALAALRVPEGVQVDFYFIPNGCIDRSENILRAFQRRMPRVYIDAAQGEPPAGERRFSHERYATFGWFAGLRNLILDRAARGGYDYLFSVDTDILLPPDAIGRLLAAGKDCCAAVITNDLMEDMPDRFRTHNCMNSDGETCEHVRRIPERLFRCDVTGSAYLLSRRAFSAGRYGWDIHGEDFPFCKDLRGAGIELWADGTLRAEHVMAPDLLFLTREQRRGLRPTQACFNDPKDGTGVDYVHIDGSAMAMFVGKAVLDSLRAHNNPDLGTEVEEFDYDRETGAMYFKVRRKKGDAACADTSPSTSQRPA